MHPKRVDDRIHLRYWMVRVKRVRDGEGIEDEHVSQSERGFLFAQIDLNTAFGDLGGPEHIAFADAGVVRMRAQRARSWGRRIRPQQAVESYERKRPSVDAPIRPGELADHEAHVSMEPVMSGDAG